MARDSGSPTWGHDVTSLIRKTVVTLLAHPFELMLSVMLAVTSIQMLLSDWTLSGSIDDDRVSGVLGGVWQVGTLFGATAVIAGLALRPWAEKHGNPQATLSRLRIIERVGCLSIATACGIYAVVLGFADWPDSAFVVAVMVAVSVGFVLRSLALGRVDQAVLSGLRTLNETTD